MTPSALFDALLEVAPGHECVQPSLVVEDGWDGAVIRCRGCSRTVWRATGA